MKRTILAALAAAALSATPAEAANRTVWLGTTEPHTLVGVGADPIVRHRGTDVLVVECVAAATRPVPRAPSRSSECRPGDFVTFERDRQRDNWVLKVRKGGKPGDGFVVVKLGRRR